MSSSGTPNPEFFMKALTNSIPVGQITVIQGKKQLEFHTLDDAAQLVGELITNMIPDLDTTSRRNFFMDYKKGDKGQVVFQLVDGTRLPAPLFSISRLMAMYPNSDEFLPREMIEDLPVHEYLRSQLLTEFLVLIYKRLMAGQVALPPTLHKQFMINLLEEIPTGSGRGWLELPEEAREEFSSMVDPMLSEMAVTTIETAPTIVRRDLELLHGIPRRHRMAQSSNPDNRYSSFT